MGKGKIPAYSHVLGGVCFKCGGSGKQDTKPAKASVKYLVLGITRNGPKSWGVIGAKSAQEAIKSARKIHAWKGTEEFRRSLSLDRAVALPIQDYHKISEAVRKNWEHGVTEEDQGRFIAEVNLTVWNMLYE